MGWPKGKPRDHATRLKMSAARKKAWANPEVRAKMSAAIKKALADPEARAKMSAARKKVGIATGVDFFGVPAPERRRKRA